MWQQELGGAVKDRGEDLSNALGQLPAFTESGADLLDVLYRQETAVRGLVRDTGEVYGALTRDERALHDLIVNSHELFSQTASQRESLAEAFHIFPTFLTESRLTLERLEGFSRRARPLVRDLRPVARELTPTIRAVRRLAPDLRRFFLRFDDQITVSREALPALREILVETPPLLRSLGPFLAEFNPIFEWLELNQHLVADFLGYAASALADRVAGVPEGETGHYLRQIGVTGPESIAIHRRRLSNNRGNAYLPPIFTGQKTASRWILPNWDCKPSGGEVMPEQGPPARVGCWVAPNLTFQGKKQGHFAHVERADYSKP
jgi:ABC-type transporter Mla subunit MlaD